MRDPQLDLVLRGGTVVTAEGQRQADVGIRDGRVASSTTGSARAAAAPPPRARSTPPDGCCCPGGVDPHVHLHTEGLDPGEPAWVDDYTSGSQAALAGRHHQRRQHVLRAALGDHRRSRARRGGAGRAPGDRRRLLPHRRSCRRARDRRRGRPRRARRPVEHEDLHVHADVRGERPAVHARHEGGGRRGRHHAGPLRGPGHHRVLHDDARPNARTPIWRTSPTAGPSKRRRSRPSARSRCAARRARRRTSSTCRRRARWRPARRRAPRACRCSSRRGRSTCT